MDKVLFAILFAVSFFIPFSFPHALAIVSDVSADWSDVANPNGFWSYNDGLGALPTNNPNWVGLGNNAWSVSASGLGHIPSWGKWIVDPTVSGIDDMMIGDVFTHSWDTANGIPGRAPSELVWTSTSNGQVTVSGDVWLGRNIERAVNWEILKNAASMTGGSLFDGDIYSRLSPFDISTGSGGAAVLQNIPVVAGDQIILRLVTTSSLGEFVGVSYSIDFSPESQPQPVGGEMLSIDSASLLLAGIQSTTWLIPVILSIVGIGVFVISKKSE